MSLVQTHLDGSKTPVDEFEMVRPATWLYHPDLDEWRLRSRVPYEQRHKWLTQEELDEEEEHLWGDEFAADDVAGQWFDVTLHIEQTYRFRIPAYTKHEAKEIAEEWRFDASPSDSMELHTDFREISDINYGELPKDYDPYGGERLVDAIERQQEDDEAQETEECPRG